MATVDEIRKAAEKDLLTFIKLVAPQHVWGKIHEDIIKWWTRKDAKSHQLLLLPRGHKKSSLIAFRVAWEITRNPATTILYISSTSNLAEKQLKAIQDILTGKIYRRYWPDMVNEAEGKREKWTTSEIAVDHPLRKTEGVRDPTVFTAGLTTSITGMHCEIAVMDDIVVQENAYTEDGRNRVRTAYSLLSSIENPDAREWVVGTRYHPKDLYNDLMEMKEDVFNSDGEIEDSVNVYEIMEHAVEDVGDGTGEFIWPRQRREDGRWFGFDPAILAKKKAQYLDKLQFFAQYYNNPNNPEGERISSDKFQYYDRKHLRQFEGNWYFKDEKLNVYSAVDFAFSLARRADYTAIVTIGVDSKGNIYVLDIDRFKTDGKISVYFEHIKDAYIKWDFKKINCEVTVAQKSIVTELKEVYIKQAGLGIKVEEFRPSKSEGSKQERMNAILEPRYDSLAVWHFKGGYCQSLEEELSMDNPPHDDIKDSLASAISISVPPKKNYYQSETRSSQVLYHPRFGGIRY